MIDFPFESTASHYPLSLLVVDDQEVNRRLLTAMLKRLGYSPLEVDSGNAAVSFFEDQTVDCVLMDINMPEIGGVEASRGIREVKKSKGNSSPIQIIAVTANAMAGDREIFLSMGMDDYIHKPLTVKELQELLIRCFQKKEGVAPLTDHFPRTNLTL